MLQPDRLTSVESFRDFGKLVKKTAKNVDTPDFRSKDAIKLGTGLAGVYSEFSRQIPKSLATGTVTFDDCSRPFRGLERLVKYHRHRWESLLCCSGVMPGPLA
jgi:hypothetical protein